MYHTTSPEIRNQNYETIDQAVQAISDLWKSRNCHYEETFFVRSGQGRRFATHGKYRVELTNGNHLIAKL